MALPITAPLRAAGAGAAALQEYAAGVPAEQSRIRLDPEDVLGFQAPSLEQIIREEVIQRPAAAAGQTLAGQPTPVMPLGLGVPLAAGARALGQPEFAEKLLPSIKEEEGTAGVHMAGLPRPVRQAEAIARPLADLAISLPFYEAGFPALAAASPALAKTTATGFVPEMVAGAITGGAEAIRSAEERGLTEPETLEAAVGAGTSAYLGAKGLGHALRDTAAVTKTLAEKVAERKAAKGGAPVAPEVEQPITAASPKPIVPPIPSVPPEYFEPMPMPEQLQAKWPEPPAPPEAPITAAGPKEPPKPPAPPVEAPPPPPPAEPAAPSHPVVNGGGWPIYNPKTGQIIAEYDTAAKAHDFVVAYNSGAPPEEHITYGTKAGIHTPPVTEEKPAPPPAAGESGLFVTTDVGGNPLKVGPAETQPRGSSVKGFQSVESYTEDLVDSTFEVLPSKLKEHLEKKYGAPDSVVAEAWDGAPQADQKLADIQGWLKEVQGAPRPEAGEPTPTAPAAEAAPPAGPVVPGPAGEKQESAQGVPPGGGDVGGGLEAGGGTHAEGGAGGAGELGPVLWKGKGHITGDLIHVHKLPSGKFQVYRTSGDKAPTEIGFEKDTFGAAVAMAKEFTGGKGELPQGLPHPPAGETKTVAVYGNKDHIEVDSKGFYFAVKSDGVKKYKTGPFEFYGDALEFMMSGKLQGAKAVSTKPVEGKKPPEVADSYADKLGEATGNKWKVEHDAEGNTFYSDTASDGTEYRVIAYADGSFNVLRKVPGGKMQKIPGEMGNTIEAAVLKVKEDLGGGLKHPNLKAVAGAEGQLEKIAVIRAITGMDLAEAKKIVEGAHPTYGSYGEFLESAAQDYPNGVEALPSVNNGMVQKFFKKGEEPPAYKPPYETSYKGHKITLDLDPAGHFRVNVFPEGSSVGIEIGNYQFAGAAVDAGKKAVDYKLEAHTTAGVFDSGEKSGHSYKIKSAGPEGEFFPFVDGKQITALSKSGGFTNFAAAKNSALDKIEGLVKAAEKVPEKKPHELSPQQNTTFLAEQKYENLPKEFKDWWDENYGHANFDKPAQHSGWNGGAAAGIGKETKKDLLDTWKSTTGIKAKPTELYQHDWMQLPMGFTNWLSEHNVSSVEWNKYQGMSHGKYLEMEWRAGTPKDTFAYKTNEDVYKAWAKSKGLLKAEDKSNIADTTIYEGKKVEVYGPNEEGEYSYNIFSKEGNLISQGTSIDSVKKANAIAYEWISNTYGPKPETPPSVKAKGIHTLAKLSDFTKLGGPTGSNEGGTFLHKPSGKKYYIKPDTADRVNQEHLAGKLYELAGIRVANTTKLADFGGKPAVASEIIEGLTPIKGTGTAPPDAWEGFGVDAWLGNRDVVGVLSGKSTGNMYKGPDGLALRLDQGGALQYRGMGESGKKTDWGNDVTEYMGLRDSNLNPAAAQVFGGMSDQQLYSALKKVADIPVDAVVDLVNKSGLTESARKDINEKLLARRMYLTKEMQALAKKLGKEVGAAYELSSKIDKWDPVSGSKEPLHGVPFDPVMLTPTSINEHMVAPPFNPTQKPAAGIAVMEPDGRVWLTKPAGKDYLTFPKGGAKHGENAQLGALREVWEETGLHAYPVGFLGDFERSTSTLRMFTGMRVSGDPSTFKPNETSEVHLVPLSQIDAYLKKPADKEIAAQLKKVWDESIKLGNGDLRKGLQLYAKKPLPPPPPADMQYAYFHKAMVEKGLEGGPEKKNAKDLDPAEWKKEAVAYALTKDSSARPDYDHPTGKDTSEYAQHVLAIANKFKTQKELKAAIHSGEHPAIITHGLSSNIADLKAALKYKQEVGKYKSVKDFLSKQLKKAAIKKFWNASKVVLNDGSPKILWHGTVDPYGKFDPNKLGTHVHDLNDYFGPHFDENPRVAIGLGKTNIAAWMVRMSKPYVVTVNQYSNFDFPGRPKTGVHSKADTLQIKKTLEGLGYDGIWVMGNKGHYDAEWGSSQWIPFYPNAQIMAINHPAVKSKDPKVSKAQASWSNWMKMQEKNGETLEILSPETLAANMRMQLKHLKGVHGEAGFANTDLLRAVFVEPIHGLLKKGFKTAAETTTWIKEQSGGVLKGVRNLSGIIEDVYNRVLSNMKKLASNFSVGGLTDEGPGVTIGMGLGPFHPSVLKVLGLGKKKAPAPGPQAVQLPPKPPVYPAPEPPKPEIKEVDVKLGEATKGAFEATPHGEVKGKPGGEPDISPNIERLNLPADTAKRFRALIEEMHATADPAELHRLKTEKWTSYDADLQELLRFKNEADFRKLAEKQGLRAIEVMAFKKLMQERAMETETKLSAYKQKLTAGVKGEELDKANADYLQSVLLTVADARAFANDGTRAARALNARKRLMDQGRTDFEKAIGLLFRGLGEANAKKLSDPEVAKLATLAMQTMTGQRSQGELHDAIQHVLTHGKMDKLLEYWKAGMLTAPPTHVANFLGNLANLVVDIGKTGVAGVVDWHLSKGHLGMGPHERERYVSDFAASLQGLLRELPGAWTGLGKDYADVVKLKEKVDLNAGQFERQIGAIEGTKGKVVRVPFQALGAVDNFFKRLFRAMEIHKEANRRAEKMIEGGSVFRGDKQNWMNQWIQDVYNPANAYKYQDVLKLAERAAERGTFQDPLGFFSGSLQRVLHGSALGKLGQLFMPFVRTPTNILKTTLRMTPGGAIEAVVKGSAGMMSRGEMADQIALSLVGSTLGSIMIMAARQGFITGGGPPDPREKQLLMDTGWRPRSLVLTIDGKKTYIPLDRLEPVGSLFGIAGDIAELSDAKKAGEALDKMSGIVVENFRNKSYLQGLNNLFNLMSDPYRYGQTVGKSIASSFVPAIVGRAAQAYDPVYRDTTGEYDNFFLKLLDAMRKSVQSRVPGASTLLEARRGPTGAPLERRGTAATRFLSPSQVSEEVGGKEVERELLRIGYLPSIPKREIRLPDGERVHLDSDEYTLLQDAREEATEEFRRLMSRPEYEALPDTIEQGGGRSKEGLARRVYDSYLDRARNRMYRRSSRLRRLGLGKRKRRSGAIRGLEIHYGR